MVIDQKFRDEAMDFYNSLSKEKKKAVSKFFRALDNDRSGTVSLDELAQFLGDEGVYICDSHVDTFKMFDRDGNGTLDFKEVITFFYYLTVGPGSKQWTIRKGNSKNLEKWKEAREALECMSVAFSLGSAIGFQIGFLAAVGGCSIM